MRPYVLHEFSEPTLPSGEPLDIDMKKNEIFPVGTTISLILESRDKQKASRWFIDNNRCAEVNDDDDKLTRNIPAMTRSEELFFRIVEYLPHPRDRYVVERIYSQAYIYSPLVDGHYTYEGEVNHGRDNVGAEISIHISTEQVQNKYFPLDENEMYEASRSFYQAQHKFRHGKITHEEFQEKKQQAKQLHNETRTRLRAERDAKYPIGSTVKVRVVAYDEEQVHETSAFLKEGDRITCKRKNIHFVGEPGTSRYLHQPNEDNYPRPWCVTNWHGELLDPSIRNLIGRGHCVRAVCVFHTSQGRREIVKYFSIVNVLDEDRLVGVLRDFYITGWDEGMEWIGKYFIIHRENISEIDDRSPTENTSLERAIKEAKLSSGCLFPTGITAIRSDE